MYRVASGTILTFNWTVLGSGEMSKGLGGGDLNLL